MHTSGAMPVSPVAMCHTRAAAPTGVVRDSRTANRSFSAVRRLSCHAYAGHKDQAKLTSVSDETQDS